MSSQAERELALSIASCSEVCASLSNASHPCHKVVNWQSKQFNPRIETVVGSRLHRPEPWTGDLAKAKIIFLSSNPSFDSDENFPNWDAQQWSDQDIAIFGADRFTTLDNRNYGATDSRDKSLRDRTIGIDGELSKRVSHWRWVRDFSSFVLDKPIFEVSAITDYVMTELVHCKSKKEEGVPQALTYCSDKWFNKIMEISPAEIIFVAGVKSGKSFAKTFGTEVPNDWGSWKNSKDGKGKGQWPKTEKHLTRLIESGGWSVETQRKNICRIEIGGRTRLVVYIGRPGGGGGLYAPWSHPNLVHEELLEFWRSNLHD